MGSRQSTDTKGQHYAAPPENLGAMNTSNTFYSLTSTLPSALQALVGKTIRGQVVGALERWADGGIWDTGNNRFLIPGQDFDVAALFKL